MKPWKALLAIMILLSEYSFGADCHLKNEICVDGPGSKSIGGYTVHRDCWKYKDTYECAEPGSVDYCAAIESTPGCTKSSSVCDVSFNGQCVTYKNTYRCGESIGSATNIDILDNSYTVTFDDIDRSACDTLSSNSSCQLAQNVCVDGPATKNIDGLDVYKDCWKWQEEYSCIVQQAVDYCSPLKSAGCHKESSTCTAYGTQSSCIEYESKYTCDDEVGSPLPANVIYLDTSYTVVSDTENTSSCTTFENNPNCSVASTVCTEGPETRNINGLDVHKECWAWKKEYSCSATELTSTCDELKSNPLCTETGSTCISELPDGSCGLVEHEFKCADAAPSTTTETNCGLQTFCIDGKCFDTGYLPDGDFAKTIATMEIFREAANYNIFNGEKNSCHKNFLVNCCKTSSGGGGGRNDVISQTMGTAVFSAAAEEIYIWGSRYIFEGLVNSGSVMLQEYAFSALGSGALSMTGSFYVWGAQFSVTTNGISFVGFNPWMLGLSIAIYVVMELMKCEEDEKSLSMKRGQGLCHKVGSWCSSKVAGSCITKKEGWCCFPSKLGRIVNEQGRAQIKKSWGSGKHPDCSGFTIEELGTLDFGAMDLSEFLNDVVPSEKSTSFAQERAIERAESYYH